ncbi:sensor histidine kinase [uncultured Phenylobacterium sp.]|uniref:sensor histidine kinase n=1 Tax=uncultured Phenylobacterium sp. TaxID=349273 RepID=UPI0025EF7AC6|nr:PAS domain S-box protein [uncultured Phenylobacterium sp.]
MKPLRRVAQVLETEGMLPRGRYGRTSRAALALTLVAASAVTTALLPAWVDGAIYAVLLSGVTFVALLCGPGVGLIAVGLAALFCGLGPVPALAGASPWAVALFVVLGLIDVAAITFLLRSNARTRAAVVRAEELVEHLQVSEARFRGLLEGAPDAIIIADAAGGIVLLNAEAERLFGYDRAELLGQNIGMLMPERFRLRHAGRIERYLESPATRRMGDGNDMFGRRKDGSEFPIETNLSPLASHGEMLVTAVVRDLSARKEIHERQSLLVRELNHRVKNALASVQSIVVQTLRTASSPEAFSAAFTARIAALSQSHDVLTRNDWSGALVEDIVREQINPYGATDQAFEIRGPRVTLGPNRSVTLGMVIGELATNAAKFGALSNGGALAVDWDVESDVAGRRLRLTWREQSLAPVSPPLRTGFGSRLIHRSVAAGLRGTAELDYRPTGLVATLAFPLLAGES